MLTSPSQLRTEYDNARIVDFRDPENPDNAIVITCEHASNQLPEGYSWSESDRLYFADEHWGYDPGALDMAMYLARELKCVLVYSLYSRLLVDVNRDITANTLFRASGDGRVIDLNKDITEEEEEKRILKYHHSYYKALRDISNKIDPLWVFSVHSFTPLYEGNMRTLEVGVLTNYCEELGHKINEGIKKRNHRAEVNEPYDGRQGLATLGALLFAKYPVNRQGVEFEFRNDLLQNPEKSSKLKVDTLVAIKEACGF
jgi:predicted N-formylglutamate amidohydrolase